MQDLIDWLRGVLDDDETIAREATRGPWTVQRQGLEAIVSPGVAMDREEGGVSVQDATHIARHDPAAVLADVAAKRAILELHKDAGMGDCAHASDPCPTLRALASAYRPGWKQEWEQ